MPKLTVAHIKRTLTPGTKIRVTNHIWPRQNRDTVVHARTNTVDLVTWAVNNYTGEEVDSHLGWPKAKDLRAGDTDNVFHIDGDGTPIVTIEVISEDHPDAATWPATCRHHQTEAPVA